MCHECGQHLIDNGTTLECHSCGRDIDPADPPYDMELAVRQQRLQAEWGKKSKEAETRVPQLIRACIAAAESIGQACAAMKAQQTPA